HTILRTAPTLLLFPYTTLFRSMPFVLNSDNTRMEEMPIWYGNAFVHLTIVSFVNNSTVRINLKIFVSSIDSLLGLAKFRCSTINHDCLASNVIRVFTG